MVWSQSPQMLDTGNYSWNVLSSSGHVNHYTSSGSARISKHKPARAGLRQKGSLQPGSRGPGVSFQGLMQYLPLHLSSPGSATAHCTDSRREGILPTTPCLSDLRRHKQVMNPGRTSTQRSLPGRLHARNLSSSERGTRHGVAVGLQESDQGVGGMRVPTSLSAGSHLVPGHGYA